jgi:murein DD-endopeptidase MepM/ murein hydrolase activator NlpD
MRYPVSATGNKVDFERDWYIAQDFGAETSYGFHEGVDINLRTGGDTDLGQEIKAIANGKIVYYHFSSHPTTTFGRHLIYRIDGAWGTRWVHCCHCTDQDFKNSVQDITEGSIIARLGKSGTPYAHLHFALLRVDPVSLPKGLDSIAHNKTELDASWEDPIKFINTWMAVVPTPQPPMGNDQTKYDFAEPFGIMELQRARSVMQEQRKDIDSKNKRLQDGAAQLRSLANQFEN